MYWLIYYLCLTYAPICVQVNINPPYKTLEACAEASIRLEDQTYRDVVEALTSKGVAVQGHIVVQTTCLIKT